MFLNMRECLRICEKSSTFAPFLHNLKISIKNMKNSIVRKTIFTFLLTVFSTFSVWSAKLCQSSYTGTVYTFGSKTVKVSVGTIGTNMYRVVFEADFEMAGSNTYVNTSENNNLSLESTTKTILDGGHRIFFDFPSTFAPNFKNNIMVRPAAQPASDYTLSGEAYGTVDWSQTTAECAALMGDDCSGWSTESLPGGNPFTKGYIYDLSSDAGGNVNISVRILDTQTGWGAPQLFMLNEYGGGIGPNPNMTWNGSTQTATHTLTGQSGTIYFKVRVPYSGGVYVTKQLSVTIGTPCAGASGCEEPSCSEPDVTTIWFLNTNGWADNVTFAYMWNGGTNNGPYPGAVMTRTDIVNNDGKRLYSITFDKDQYVNVKFNCNSNNDGCYTGDLSIEPFQCYNFASGWVNRPCSVVVATDVNSYSTSADPMTFKCNSLDYVARVNFNTTGNHAFKIVATDNDNNYWYGCNPGSTPTASFSNYAFSTSGGNMPFTADVPGEYYFEFNYATQTVSVVYPPYMTSANCSSSTTTTITLAVASTRGTKYHVVDATHGVDQIVTPAAGLITVTGLTPSTEYTFTVTAMDNNDTESVNNASSICTTMDPPSSVPANREDLTECQVLSVIGTTKYTPMGILNRQGWSGEKGEAVTIGAKGDNNVWCMYDGVASALILHESSNVQLFSKIHFEVWTAEAMTIDFGLLCWLNNVYNEQDGGPGTYQRQTITTTAGSWTTVEYTLTNLTTYAYLANVSHLYFYNLNKKEVYLTNAYFYNDDNTKPVLTSATSNGVSGTDATLTVTATYKGASINTFRVTNTTTGDVYDRTADGSNHITIPDIYPCESYSLSVRAINVYCILSDEEQIIPINGESLAANSPLIRSGMTVSADAVGLPLADAIDNNTASRWASGGSAINVPHWFQIDLGSVRDVTSWKIAWEASCPKDYYLEGSVDGTNYYPLLHETTKPTNASAEASPFNDYDTYTFTAAIGVRYLKVRSITNNTGYGMSIWEMQAYGDCYTASDKPVTTFALLESQELNSMSTAVNATIEVGAYDYATEFDDMYYKLSITPTGGSTTILDNQTATSGLITLADLEPGTEYTVVITARDGNNGNLADNSVTVVFTTLDVDPTICSREGGVGSGQSFAGATLFGTGYSYSVKWKAGSTGNPDSLIVSAEILDDITTGRILLFFHKTESGDEMYEEVEVAPAVDRTKVVTNKCIAIPPKVRDYDYAYLSVKFEKDGGGVYFTDRMFYDLKHGGCAEPSEAYFDIYHWDDAPVGARTSYNGGTIVTKIRYFRHFDTNWTTISLPFEVERVAVYDETDHLEYPLFPRFHNNTTDVEGYYWLKTFPNWNTVPVPIRDFQATWQQLTVATDYDGWDGGNIRDFEETWLAANVKPEKNTPYAIKFPYSGYYETNWVIFYGAAFQTIASDFTGGTSITLTNDNYDYDQVKLQCNNTMHPSSALNNIYMIEEGTDLFTRRESQAVPAFESYVIGTHEVQARYSVLRWSGSTPSTTDLDNRPTTADGAGKVYTVSGICVASFADSEQMETVLNTLNAGVYVVRVGSQINKVFVR